MLGEAGQRGIKVGTGKYPVKCPDRGVVALFEGEDPAGEDVELGEVVWGQQLVLEDGN